ncbi:MAG: hypothetical protein IPK73_07470 [Candidatus Obscuribacter sp.]|nr:hypothetical protein [Candidatus Obscuribacter sp.]MBK9279438.1 hypothetical protein [Candidatus Obscuribacter sp.]
MKSEITENRVIRRLEKARLDFGSLRTQMALAAILIFTSCLVNFWSTLKDGFLLDDFLHLDYCARFMSGEMQPFLSNLTGNWGASDLMLSYRPVVSISLLADYLLYGTAPWGYHLTNVLLFAACAILTAALSLLVCQRLAPRLAGVAAIWSGLLFSCYPLHTETVAWIIGRVDSLATLFYLAALIFYWRAKQHDTAAFRKLSLLSFVLALASKEIAVSLPGSLFLLSIVHSLPGKEKFAHILKRAFKETLPYLGVLALFALARHLMLGSVIGGYGKTDFNPIHILTVFADYHSLLKILVPVSEEYRYLSQAMRPVLLPLLAILSLVVLRLLVKGGGKSRTLFILPLLMLWSFGALLPAFQIWHIHPNLVGSRLFFLSSVPLCMVLTLKAVPGHGHLTLRELKYWALGGFLALSGLYLVWCEVLSLNLRAWHDASMRMQVFMKELNEKALIGKPIILANLPQDYKGAGMIGRRLYLDIMLKPPLNSSDISSKILTVKVDGAYFNKDGLKEALKMGGKEAEIIYFDNDRASFSKYRGLANAPLAEGNLIGKLSAAQGLLLSKEAEKERQWKVLKEGETELRLSRTSPGSLALNVPEKTAFRLPLPLGLPSLYDQDESCLQIDLVKQTGAGDGDVKLVILNKEGQVVETLALAGNNGEKTCLLSGLTCLVRPDVADGGKVALYFEPGNYLLKGIYLLREKGTDKP